ncbi:MAG: LptF/LptG family permease, partial [Alphaproteobacteria bacterium]
MVRILDVYLLRQIITPMFVTLMIAVMLLLLDKMLKLFDFVINEGGPVSVVWRMLGNLLPQYFSLAIPLGLFLGVMMAFRRLAMNSELDAIISAGISHPRLLRVPILIACLASVATITLSGFVQPITRYAYKGLIYDLRSGALGASIKVKKFVDIGENLTLRIEESRDGGRALHHIFARRVLKGGAQFVVTAQRGTF